MDLFLLKIIAAFVILFETFSCGILPIFTINRFSGVIRERFLGISNSLSGGIFLSAGFIHLLGETEEVISSHLSTDFPLAYLCSALGFLFTFFIEKVVFSGVHSHAHSSDSNESISTDSLLRVKPNAGGEEGVNNYGSIPKRASDSDTNKSPSPTQKKRGIRKIFGKYFRLKTSTDTNEVSSNLTSPVAPGEEKTSPDTSSGSERVSRNVFGSLLLLLVLSIHSFTEGLALGVQMDLEKTTVVFAAIASHKWAESFALGSSFVRSNSPRKRLLLLVGIYSFMTPIGIGLGTTLTSLIHNDTATDLIEAFSGAFASGIFIYVAALDILAEEFDNPRDKWLKTFSCMVGFSLMTALFFAFGHDHDDSSIS